MRRRKHHAPVVLGALSHARHEARRRRRQSHINHPRAPLDHAGEHPIPERFPAQSRIAPDAHGDVLRVWISRSQPIRERASNRARRRRVQRDRLPLDAVERDAANVRPILKLLDPHRVVRARAHAHGVRTSNAVASGDRSRARRQSATARVARAPDDRSLRASRVRHA